MSGTSDRVPPEPPTAVTVAALPEVLSRNQAAWLLQLTPGRLDAAYKRGDVPGRQVGRKRLFSKSALLRLVSGDPGS